MTTQSSGFLVIAFMVSCSGSVMAQGLPLKEHEMLKMDEGTWNAKISILAGPNEEPLQSTAIETNTMCGELWSVGKLKGNIAGSEYTGYATLGYDPIQKKYVGTWVDSVTPEITHMSGTYDEKTRTLTLFYNITREEGPPEERKNIMVYKDGNTREFTMFIKNGDQWNKSMTILYERMDQTEEK